MNTDDQVFSTRIDVADNESPTLTFFRQWLRNPSAMAAVSPSGRQLAALMVKQLPRDARRVIELGGGTGVFTRALLDHGIEPGNLLVIELNEALHSLLRERFPRVRIERGDARHVRDTALRSGVPDANGKVDAVISGLGMLSMPRETQRGILQSSFEVLREGGRFIQFTYGPTSPIPRELLDALHLNVRRGGTAWRNVPPANVFVYRRA